MSESSGEQKKNKRPRAYEEGTCDFYGRKFQVSPEVLIPRPETEMIVDTVLSLAGKSILPGVKASKARVDETRLTILDVGTGSGCIAITLALELMNARVVAVDVSSEALRVARENARRLETSVEFLRSDLLAEVSEFLDLTAGDLVVTANLPYVDQGWEWLDKAALGYEPDLALYAEDGGLAVYKRLFADLNKKFVQTYGKLFVVVEADPCQHEELKKYAETLGFRHIETRGFALLFVAARAAGTRVAGK